jgi:predicted carbohydrate-binding protein with CBM5 and CBM33 domain
MSTAVSLTTPTSSKTSSQTSYTPPTIGSAKKKLKFSPKENFAAKKQAFIINFCDRDEVKIECLKYLKHAVDIPIDQEGQLTFLLNQYQARDIQASFYKLIGEVGGVAVSAFIPMSSQKKKLINEFLCLIYDHKSMLINTVEQSYR